ncbi:MAG TPA: anti-sigma regulatory factor [Thermoclostridium sp.]|nr:anti-sigma regulatory factor [Thermoclostridium sp.]HPU44767.1 anti-sigma regulatory factor [Thermoclostridium sp.]
MKPLDTVSVLIPSKAEYVSIVRLTASGIANRMGFDIDEIEDIKVSISEAISRMIDKGISSDSIRIDFHLYGDFIRIDFRLSGSSTRDIFESEEDGFAFEIIRALMDEVNLDTDDHVLLSMTKKLERAV